MPPTAIEEKRTLLKEPNIGRREAEAVVEDVKGGREPVGPRGFVRVDVLHEHLHRERLRRAGLADNEERQQVEDADAAHEQVLAQVAVGQKREKCRARAASCGRCGARSRPRCARRRAAGCPPRRAQRARRRRIQRTGSSRVRKRRRRARGEGGRNSCSRRESGGPPCLMENTRK